MVPDPSIPLVSLIVPVYKVEDCLPRCLDSIAAQTYPNLDVILVDDGSPDSCGDLCERFAQAHPNVRVMHQANQGLSAARNNAVPLARGDWVTFIDSDDFVSPDHVEYLVRLALDHQADIAVSGYVYEYEPSATTGTETEVVGMTPAEMLARMNYGEGFGVFAWGKLYRKALVLAHPYPVGKLYEDLATTYKLVGDSSRAVFGNRKTYHWLQRAGSIMRARFDERQLYGLEAARAQLEYVAEKFPAALPAARFRHTAKGVELAKLFFESGGADPAVWKRLRDHVAIHGCEVLRDPRAKRTLKLRIRAILLGRFPARVALGFHDWLKRKIL